MPQHNPWRGRKKPKGQCRLCHKTVVKRLDGTFRAHYCQDGYTTPPPAETK